MKRLLTALICACSITVHAQQAYMPNPASALIVFAKLTSIEFQPVYYVRVKSTAPSESAAKTQAFKAAVEYTIGAVVSAETEVNARDQQVVRNEIISYSAGYIHDYKVVELQNTSNGVTLIIDTWVKKSKIADRLLNESKGSGSVEGQRVSDQYKSLMHERTQGDRLIYSVLRDYPRRAYNVATMPTQAKIDSDRMITLSIPFKLSWNQDYINSLNEILEKTSEKNGAGFCFFNPRECQYNYYVNLKMRPGAKGWVKIYGYNDTARYALFVRELVHSRPMALLTVKSQSGNVVHRACYNFAELSGEYNFYAPNGVYVENNPDNIVQINGYQDITANINLRMNPTQSNLDQWEQVNVQIVRANQCPN